MGLTEVWGMTLGPGRCSVLLRSGARAPPRGLRQIGPTTNGEGVFGQINSRKGVFSVMAGFEASHCGLEWLWKRFSAN